MIEKKKSIVIRTLQTAFLFLTGMYFFTQRDLKNEINERADEAALSTATH